MFQDHFFERLLGFVSIGGGGEFISVMDAADDEFLIHLYCKDGVAFLELFVPTITGVVVGEDELLSHAVAAAEDDRPVFPVHTRVMAFEPIMSEVYVLLAEVCYGEINAFVVISDHQGELYKFGDVPALIAGSVGVVDWNGDERLLCIEVVLLDVCLIDGASCTATVDQGLRR